MIGVGYFLAGLIGALVGAAAMIWALGKGLDFMDLPAVDPYWDDEDEYQPIDRGGKEILSGGAKGESI